MKEERVVYIDALKFVAIYMVVWGHVQGMFEDNQLTPCIRNFIVGVNMPLFFAISGYFAGRSIREGNVGKVLKTVTRYAYPILVCSILFALARLAISTSHDSIAYGVGLFTSYWFVWSLILCMLLSLALSLLARHYGKIVGVLGVLGCFAFLMIIHHSLIVKRTVHLMPYFLAACYFRDVRHVQIGARSNMVGLLCLISYLLSSLICGDCRTNGLGFYWNDFTWVTVFADPKIVFLAACRYVIGIVGIIGFAYACRVALNAWRGLEGLTVLGTTTLGVYIIHWPILPYITKLVSKLPPVGTWVSMLLVALLTALLFAVCHIATRVTMKCSFTKRYFWIRG